MLRRLRTESSGQPDGSSVGSVAEHPLLHGWTGRTTSDLAEMQLRAVNESPDQQRSFVRSTTTTSAFALRRTNSINITVPTPQKNALGLTLVHDAQHAAADVIFVHGLGGYSWNSWCWEHDPEFFWPAWLQHEHGLKHLRVFTFGYNANFRGPDTPLSILDFAKGLLVRMKGYGYDGSKNERPLGKRPIIFVSHSMGGLVVKKAYILGRFDDHYSSMITKVHSIFFLSTPHRGSSHASTLNNILSVMIGTSSKGYVSELDTNSTSIEDLNEQFRALCGSLRLVSLYETLPTKLVKGVKRLLVDKDTGVLNYPKEISSPMDADHHSICKYRSRIDDNYILVINLLKQVTRDLAAPLNSPTTPQRTPYKRSRTLESVLGIQENPGEDLEKHMNQCLHGTCEWFRSRESFGRWLSAPDDGIRLLCLAGLPGTGKSTLAATTTSYLQKVFLSQSCQYHFFVEAQPKKKSIAYCLRSIAYQIASTHDEFAERLLQLSQDAGDALASQNFHTIWTKVFEGILFKMDIGYTLHWVIDAVDESESPIALIKLLSQMQPSSCIKVLLLSRPSKDIANIATSHNTSALYDSISISDTMGDIRGYIRHIVSETIPKEELLQQDILEQLMSRAEGSFLWARLALDTLRDNWHTHGDIQRAMSTIPEDMESLYLSMAETIRGQDTRLQEIAGRILTWATCSFRPMKIAELQVALEPEFGVFVSLRDTIMQICGNFVRLDGGNASLIHSTARQFLVTASKDGQPLVSHHSGHEYLARVCLIYLSDERWRRLLSQVPEAIALDQPNRMASVYENHPFLRYAMSHWAYHVRHSPINSPSLLQHLKLFFTRHVLSWIQASALSGSLHDLPQAAHFIKTYLKRVARGSPASIPPVSSSFRDTELGFLERWSVDLIRLLGKFGTNLAQTPASIFKNIPPLCPQDSIISEVYSRQDNPLLQVTGISANSWDDNLARLSVGQDVTASKVRCAGMYFLALVSSSGTIVVWSAQTCQELRRLSHGEWVVLMETNESGSLVVSTGINSFRIWDISTGQQLQSISKDPQLRVMDLRISDADTRLTVAFDDCSIVCYDILDEIEPTEEQCFVAQGLEALHFGCPRLIALSPDTTHVAIAYRGRPVTVWDLASDSGQQPRRCIRAADEARWESSEADVFNAPEVVVWHPDGNSLYILYQDATILHWNLIEDERTEYPDTEAREMTINCEGTFLLTGNYTGTLSVWALPRMNLVYRLRSEEFVRDLCFSPDSQRIYDVRGSICNVWEPDFLVRSDEMDRQDSFSSTIDSAFSSELIPEPVYSRDAGGVQVTALVCDSDGSHFCCGRDDGSVIIHEMERGERVRKVTNHSSNSDIISLAWSSSGKYLVSGDDWGKVIAKRVKLKGDGKWAVFPVFEARTGNMETVTQLLFSHDETHLLIGTASSDQIWNLTTKALVYKGGRETGPVGRWINHPFQATQLVWVDGESLRTFEWAGFKNEATRTISIQGSSIASNGRNDSKSSLIEVSLTSEDKPTRRTTLQALSLSTNSRFLVYQTSSVSSHTFNKTNANAEFWLLETRNIQSQTAERINRKRLSELSFMVQRFLGCHRDRIVFIDYQGWICTSEVGGDAGKLRRHFFLPKDWLNTWAAQPLVFTKQGALLVPRNGDVAILRYSKGIY
ncbi:hypothetical protein B0T25DRAFT_553490 [Lasiosphaeria hispida]|uniref:GPI inositol-deacylase n=1 Tax=Lasiosphaeria hispida TaxID=260671 RepID=A0AAJ0MBM1_9PEZI|nr:hypothetical protein B0T25DRAFT_553490 [Lasiosphaeria hispida]